MTPYRDLIRAIPDFPAQGVVFRDITPLLRDADAFRAAVHDLAAPYKDARINRVVAIEARGYLLGAPIAVALGAGFVPVRKRGRLPYKTFSAEYALEYGESAIEMHIDALGRRDRVLVVDDVLATGGTLAATVELVGRADAEIAGAAVLIELDALQGRALVPGLNVTSLVHY